MKYVLFFAACLLTLVATHAQDASAQTCAPGFIKAERITQDQYHFTGQIEMPNYCREVSIDVPYKPTINSKQRIWGTITIERPVDKAVCAGAIDFYPIDIKTPAHPVLSSEVTSRLNVVSDFDWSPIAYMGEPPKFAGDVTCLRPVSSLKESRGLFRLNGQ